MSKKYDLKLISSKTVYKNPWFYIQKEKFRYPDGKEKYYFVFRRNGPFVAVVAKKAESTLLIKQFRQTIKKEIWELPMGAVDKGETIEDAGRREFFEETGYQAGRIERAGNFYVGPGHSDQRGFVLLATEISKSSKKRKGEDGEIIVGKKWIKFSELERLISHGKIEDGPTICAFFIVKKYLEKQ